MLQGSKCECGSGPFSAICIQSALIGPVQYNLCVLTQEVRNDTLSPTFSHVMFHM